MQGRRLGFNFDVAPSLQELCVFYFGGNRQDEGMTEYKGKSRKAKCGSAEKRNLVWESGNECGKAEMRKYGVKGIILKGV